MNLVNANCNVHAGQRTRHIGKCKEIPYPATHMEKA